MKPVIALTSAMLDLSLLPEVICMGKSFFTREDLESFASRSDLIAFTNYLPNPGEMAFFDRSWYNGAVVESVMGFCSKKCNQFRGQLSEFEYLLYEDNLKMIKFWFSNRH